MLLLFLLVVAAAAVGVAEIVARLRGTTVLPVRQAFSERSIQIPRVWLLSGAAGVVVLLVTRWPAAALVVVGVGVLWPRLVGGAADGRRQLATIEALAVWTESLRDVAGSSSGLEEALRASALQAPAQLRQPLRNLTSRLDVKVPLPEALTYFADDLDDAAAERVVGALALNARQRSEGLTSILSELAVTSRSELEMRRETEHQRRSIRRDSQIIAAAVLGVVIVQALVAPSYTATYSSPVGKMVLTVLAVAFLASFARLRNLAKPDKTPRFLASAEQVTEVASYRPRPLGARP